MGDMNEERGDYRAVMDRAVMAWRMHEWMMKFRDVSVIGESIDERVARGKEELEPLVDWTVEKDVIGLIKMDKDFIRMFPDEVRERYQGFSDMWWEI